MRRRLSIIVRTWYFVRGAVPEWVRSTAVLTVVYVVVIVAVAHWLLAWHDWDWQFFDWLEPAPAVLSSQMALIDMQYASADPSQVPEHRELLANFLRAAAKQHPIAVILDIPFGECPAPCGSAMLASRQALISAIDDAKRLAVSVYANVGSTSNLTPEGLPDGPAVMPLDPQIYGALSGYGHTAAVVLRARETPRAGDLFYYECYAAYPALFSGGSPQDVWALVDVVTHPEVEAGPVVARSQICDPAKRIAVRYGPAIADSPPEEYQVTAARPFPRGLDVAAKYVVVGVPEFDKESDTTSRPGSELFAWILSDELTNHQFNQPTIQAQGRMLGLLVPAFSSITVLAFATWFLGLRRLSLGGARRFLPWVAAALAFCSSIVAFALFEVWMLRGPSHQLQPQVALISLGMLLAASLSGVRGKQIEFATLNKIEAPPDQEQHDYDVFISYAHDELPWVMDHVYLPLKTARLAGGRALKIFFDTDEIKIGTAWQDKISLAIDGSTFIIPVYSDIYFKRPYCGFEIRRAHRKWINEGQGSRCVLPIMRGHPKILGTVDDVQAISVDDDANIVDKVIREVVDRLSAAGGTHAST